MPTRKTWKAVRRERMVAIPSMVRSQRGDRRVAIRIPRCDRRELGRGWGRIPLRRPTRRLLLVLLPTASIAPLLGRRRSTPLQRRRRERTPLVRELLGPGTRVGAFKETALVAEDFARAEVGATPGGGVGGAAVEAPPADPIAELGGGIVRVDDGHGGLAGLGVGRRGMGAIGTGVGHCGDGCEMGGEPRGGVVGVVVVVLVSVVKGGRRRRRGV